MDEPNMFSGLVCCADCGKPLVLHRASAMKKTKYNFQCCNFGKRGKGNCSPHHIRKMALVKIVLDDIRRVTHSARTQERQFAQYINLAAVDEAVEDGCGNGSVAEEIGLLVKFLVGSNNEGSSLAHGGDESKEKIGLGRREGHEAHLVHHHEGCFVKILEAAFAGAGNFSGFEDGHEASRALKPTVQPRSRPWTARERARWVLPTPGGPRKQILNACSTQVMSDRRSIRSLETLLFGEEAFRRFQRSKAAFSSVEGVKVRLGEAGASRQVVHPFQRRQHPGSPAFA